jgi:hypothetical protein
MDMISSMVAPASASAALPNWRVLLALHPDDIGAALAPSSAAGNRRGRCVDSFKLTGRKSHGHERLVRGGQGSVPGGKWTAGSGSSDESKPPPAANLSRMYCAGKALPEV